MVFRKGLAHAGARGYLSKQADETEILGAIQAVAQGRTYVSATLAGYLLQAPIPITAREQEILELVAGGETDPKRGSSTPGGLGSPALGRGTANHHPVCDVTCQTMRGIGSA